MTRSMSICASSLSVSKSNSLPGLYGTLCAPKKPAASCNCSRGSILHSKEKSGSRTLDELELDGEGREWWMLRSALEERKMPGICGESVGERLKAATGE